MDNPYKPPSAEFVLPPAHGRTLVHPPATALRRGFAAAIDQLLSILLTAVFMLPLAGETLDELWVSQLLGVGGLLTSSVIFGLLEGSRWQASPGKKLLGLRVIRLDGGPVHRGRALQRNLFKSIGLSACGLIVITVFTSPGRSIWDRATDTMVVHPD